MRIYLYLWEVYDMLQFIWNWMTSDLRNKIEGLEKDIKEYETQTLKLNNKCFAKDVQIHNLDEIIRNHETTTKEERYWNYKWRHNTIRHKAQDGLYRDVRSIINYPSYIAEETVLFNNLKKSTEEDTLFTILNWVVNNIKYARDMTTRKTIEFWEDSDITLQRKTGDCEDFALIFKALCLACGIPDYKVKIVAGDVVIGENKTGGHAYPIVLYENKWYAFDCTYYVDKTPLKERIEVKNDNRYKRIWWTFNKKFCFSENIINGGEK